jgi:hypothetical protein
VSERALELESKWIGGRLGLIALIRTEIAMVVVVIFDKIKSMKTNNKK